MALKEPADVESPRFMLTTVTVNRDVVIKQVEGHLVYRGTLGGNVSLKDGLKVERIERSPLKKKRSKEARTHLVWLEGSKSGVAATLEESVICEEIVGPEEVELAIGLEHQGILSYIDEVHARWGESKTKVGVTAHPEERGTRQEDAWRSVLQRTKKYENGESKVQYAEYVRCVTKLVNTRNPWAGVGMSYTMITEGDYTPVGATPAMKDWLLENKDGEDLEEFTVKKEYIREIVGSLKLKDVLASIDKVYSPIAFLPTISEMADRDMQSNTGTSRPIVDDLHALIDVVDGTLAKHLPSYAVPDHVRLPLERALGFINHWVRDLMTPKHSRSHYVPPSHVYYESRKMTESMTCDAPFLESGAGDALTIKAKGPGWRHMTEGGELKGYILLVGGLIPYWAACGELEKVDTSAAAVALWRDITMSYLCVHPPDRKNALTEFGKGVSTMSLRVKSIFFHPYALSEGATVQYYQGSWYVEHEGSQYQSEYADVVEKPEKERESWRKGLLSGEFWDIVFAGYQENEIRVERASRLFLHLLRLTNVSKFACTSIFRSVVDVPGIAYPLEWYKSTTSEPATVMRELYEKMTPAPDKFTSAWAQRLWDQVPQNFIRPQSSGEWRMKMDVTNSAHRQLAKVASNLRGDLVKGIYLPKDMRHLTTSSKGAFAALNAWALVPPGALRNPRIQMGASYVNNRGVGIDEYMRTRDVDLVKLKMEMLDIARTKGVLQDYQGRLPCRGFVTQAFRFQIGRRMRPVAMPGLEAQVSAVMIYIGCMPQSGDAVLSTGGRVNATNFDKGTYTWVKPETGRVMVTGKSFADKCLAPMVMSGKYAADGRLVRLTGDLDARSFDNQTGSFFERMVNEIPQDSPLTMTMDIISQNQGVPCITTTSVREWLEIVSTSSSNADVKVDGYSVVRSEGLATKRFAISPFGAGTGSGGWDTSLRNTYISVSATHVAMCRLVKDVVLMGGVLEVNLPGQSCTPEGYSYLASLTGDDNAHSLYIPSGVTPEMIEAHKRAFVETYSKDCGLGGVTESDCASSPRISEFAKVYAVCGHTFTQCVGLSCETPSLGATSALDALRLNQDRIGDAYWLFPYCLAASDIQVGLRAKAKFGSPSLVGAAGAESVRLSVMPTSSYQSILAPPPSGEYYKLGNPSDLISPLTDAYFGVGNPISEEAKVLMDGYRNLDSLGGEQRIGEVTCATSSIAISKKDVRDGIVHLEAMATDQASAQRRHVAYQSMEEADPEVARHFKRFLTTAEIRRYDEASSWFKGWSSRMVAGALAIATSTKVSPPKTKPWFTVVGGVCYNYVPKLVGYLTVKDIGGELSFHRVPVEGSELKERTWRYSHYASSTSGAMSSMLAGYFGLSFKSAQMTLSERVSKILGGLSPEVLEEVLRSKISLSDVGDVLALSDEDLELLEALKCLPTDALIAVTDTSFRRGATTDALSLSHILTSFPPGSYELDTQIGLLSAYELVTVLIHYHVTMWSYQFETPGVRFPATLPLYLPATLH